MIISMGLSSTTSSTRLSNVRSVFRGMSLTGPVSISDDRLSWRSQGKTTVSPGGQRAEMLATSQTTVSPGGHRARRPSLLEVTGQRCWPIHPAKWYWRLSASLATLRSHCLFPNCWAKLACLSRVSKPAPPLLAWKSCLSSDISFIVLMNLHCRSLGFVVEKAAKLQHLQI